MTDCYLESDDIRRGYISGHTFDLKPVEYAVVPIEDPDTGAQTEYAIYEGCIVLGTVEEMETLTREVRKGALAGELPETNNYVSMVVEQEDIQQGVGITGAKYRWPHGRVPYQIHPSLPNKARVTDAINHWQQKTKMRFVLRTPSNASRYPNYINFIPATGCWSYVGMQGGAQNIGLASGCSTGSTIHEIGHAIGLWHEQSREDRDQFIKINWQNINPLRVSNFTQHINDGDDYGNYDYDSIMHYPPKAFSINGRPTIEPLQPGVTIGQRVELSAGDIGAVRAMYPNLESSRSWIGTQFRGQVNSNSTQCWFTHSWPAFWHVDWNVVPTGPAQDGPAQIEWKVRVTRQSDSAKGQGGLLKYFVCVKNLTNYPVDIEARYHVLGWHA